MEGIEQAFAGCRRHGLHTHAYLMLGAPVEDREDLERTYRLVRRIRPNSWRVFITTPFPGNQLYEYARDRGLLRAGTYAEMDGALNAARLVMPIGSSA